MPAAESWPAIANGQLAIVPSLDATAGLDALRSAVAVPPAKGYGRSLPNFHFTRVRLALMPPPGSVGGAMPTPIAQTVSPSPGAASLDMRGGVLALSCLDATSGCTVSHELRAMMHMPGFAMHTITVVVPAGLAPPGVGATLQVQHELRAPTGSTCSFSGESLASANASAAGSFFALAGEAETSFTGEDGIAIRANVACASTYLIECRNSASVGQQLPPPAYAEQRGKRAVATFYVSAAPSPTTSSPTTLRFHVLTSVATSLEVAQPSAAARRSLMAVAAQAAVTTSGQVAAKVASSLIAAHDAAWVARWATYVDVSGADARVVWTLRYAFYNLHSCTRPLGPAVDLSGTSLAGGRADDFVGALLTLCAPESARSALESRWASLAAYAGSLSRDAGLHGARFPHAGELDGDETITDGDEDQASLRAQDQASETAAKAGYSPSSWWQLGGGSVSTRLHATSMAAISAWNYYRATQDGDWLSSRGYPILKAAADMLSAYCVCPDPTNRNSVYRLPAAVGLDVTRPADTDPSLEVAAVVAAMRCATEAAYQLGFAPPEIWTAVRYGLSVSKISVTSNIVASDAGGPTPIGFPMVAGTIAAQAGLASGAGPLVVAEPLLVFAEPVASLADALNLNPGLLSQNLAYWGNTANRVTSSLVSPIQIAIGDLVILLATAQAAQLGGQAGAAQASAFLGRLNDFIDRHSDLGPSSSGGNGGGWGNLRPASGPPAAPNDLGLSCLLLLVFVQSLAGAQLQGGVTQAQFIYSSLGVNAATTSCLPPSWNSITVHGLGPARVDVVLLNNLGGGGARGGAQYASWSVSALTL